MASFEDAVLFVILPYVAVAVAVIGSVYRYYSDRFSLSSQSSQLLERPQLFLGSNAWHYGIIIILGAHIVAAVLPSFWSSVIADSTRLYVMEVTGWALALILGGGLGILIARRITKPRVAAVTSSMDWVLLASLAIQVVLGIYIAVTQRWGALWYLQIVVPWLQSLVGFNPQVQTVSFLPTVVKLHILNALLLVMLIPFTRLIHMFTFPVTYLWRPYQVVAWTRSRGFEPAEPTVLDQKMRAESRRTLIKVSLLWLGAIAGVAVFLEGLLPPPPPPPSQGTTTSTSSATGTTSSSSSAFPRVKVANISDLSTGTPLSFNYPLQETPNMLVKLGVKASGGVGPDGDVVAFSTICQHLGCLYGYVPTGKSPECDSSYKAATPVGYCCCHSSVYDLANAAKVLGGPSPRPQPQVILELDSSTGDIYATGMLPPAIFGHNTGSNDVSNDLQGGTLVT